ncbi:MAG TPA: hypothetical protein VMT16_13850 [Thermoanaerobaculia bacterium]|nr:hypothetical protein [Thermoanaerobaculia bacterium]
MKRWESWSVHASLLLVGITGLIYAWMRYLLAPTDPYAVVNHPLQPAMQHLHVLTAPLLVFAVGLIWRAHVWSHWRKGVGSRRRSGLLLLANLAPMVLSGYLIQTTVSEGWRVAWVVVHCTTAALFLVGYGGHLLARLSQSAPAAERRRVPAGDPATAPSPR